MCGIFGFVGARARAESIDLGAAVKAMHHRGPDGRGTYFNVPPRNQEIACALAHPRLSHRGLATFLMYGSVSDPYTILDDVFSLLPGHRGELANGRVTIEPYWELPSTSRPASFAEAVDRVGPLLRDAAQSELTADVPLGVFLSGGIDSSTIAGYASSASDTPVPTFTVTFDEETDNEEKFAAQVAARFRCDHRQVHLSAGSALEELDRVFASADQPSADGVNTYFVSKAAREAGLAVALSGLGGYELFAGYSNFRLFRSMLRSGLVASKFPTFFVRSMTGAAFNGRSIRSRKFAAILSAGGSPGRTYSVLRSMFTPEQVIELDDVSLHSRLELTRYLRNTLLRDTDTMSMAHSLEVRVPLLDHYLAEAVLPLPRNVKLSRGVNKPLMIAAGPQLPGDIISRRKMGFILPLEAWLVGPNADRMRGILEAPWTADDVIATDTLRSVWKLYEEGSPSVSFSRIWSLAALKDSCIRNHVSA